MDSQSGALADIIGLARLSRLTLLYHGAAAGDAARVQASVLAGAGAAAQDIVVLFDGGSEFPVSDLMAAIEAAVLEAAPQAPLAPPMAGPVEALAFWEQALGLRFLLIVQRFDLALARPDPEFDEVLIRLVHDPLDASVLLLMDEAAAPLLQRLKPALPELGETFLRLPEPAAMAPASAPPSPPAAEAAPEPTLPPAAPAPRFGPAPFLLDDPADDIDATLLQPPHGQPDADAPAFMQPLSRQPAPAEEEQPEPQAEQRRLRRFSSLLEQARISPGAFEPAAEAPPGPPGPPVPAPEHEVFPAAEPAGLEPPAMPAEIYPAAAPATFMPPPQALPDGRAEPTLQPQPPAAAAPAAGGRIFRERRPMQVPAWMQKRRSRRRRSTVGIASRVGSSATVLFVLLAMLAVLGWQMPQMAAPAAFSPAPAHHAVALRGNR